MATITRYVNPGSSGGNGTTSALSGANAAYASLNAWEAAEQQNLTDGGGDVMVVNCAGTSADTTNCTVAGWTTGVGNTITIIGDNTTGKWDTSKYILSTTADSSMALFVNQTYVEVYNIQVSCISTSASGWMIGILMNVGTGTKCGKCIVKMSSAGLGIAGIQSKDGGGSGIVYNCISYSTGGTDNTNNKGFSWINVSGTGYNNTAYGNGIGFYGEPGGVPTINNNISTTNGTDYSSAWGWNVASADNISTDTTSPNNEWDSTTLANIKFVNTTASSEDFHLQSGSAAIDGGTDNSGVFTDDIDGVTRTGTWDIGADEFVAVASAAKGFMTTNRGWWGP